MPLGYVAHLCYRLWRRWHRGRGRWLVEVRPVDGPPVYRRVSREQFTGLIRAIRAEHREEVCD